MASKRRDFHDLSEDEDDQSESGGLHEESRFTAFPYKKMRVDSTEDEDAHSASNSEDEGEDQDPEDSHKSEDPKEQRDGQKKVKPLTTAELESSRRKARKTGVVYISRVPPFMKPSTLRNLLSPLGEIGRIFLTPEPSPAYLKRVKSGGNKKRSFLDGWVEFTSKRNAKACVELLNGNIIGGKKNGFYHDDLWNLKYLKGFKWSDLMEQVQGEDKMREGQLRAELLREARERKAFLHNVELSKQEKGMEEKRQRKAQEKGGKSVQRTEHGTTASTDGEPRKVKFERHFRQNEVKEHNSDRQISESERFKRIQNSLL